MELLTVVLLGLLGVIWFLRSRPKNIPPGPTPLPVVGSIFSVGSNYDWPVEMCNRYGPIFSLYFGSKLCVFVTDPELAKEAFVNKASLYSARSMVPSMDIVTMGGKSIAMSEGEYWKKYRRLLMVSLTKMKVKVSEDHIHQQIDDLFKGLDVHADTGKPVHLAKYFHTLTMNVVTSLCFSLSSPLDPESNCEPPTVLLNAMDTLTKLVGPRNPYDFLPFLKPFYKKEIELLKDSVRIRDECLLGIINNHSKKLDRENPSDLADMLLLEAEAQGMQKEELVPVLQDILLGGTETSANELIWFFAFLMNNSHYWERLEKEVNDAFPNGVTPCYEQREKTPFLFALMKEIMRLRPVAFLGLPHRVTEDDNLGGYYIPKDSRVFLNILGIHHKPDVWENPYEFRPERFLNNNNEARGTDFQYLPFGVGLRICPGLNLAYVEIYLTLARIFQKYRFERCSKEPLDLTPEVGLTITALPYQVYIKRR